MLAANGRVIMISGANRGIGRAIAQTLAEAGYRLSLGARDPASIDASVYPSETLIAHYDALERESSTAWASATEARFGAIDGVVLNAGVLLPAGFEDDDETAMETAMDTMWAVNFKGPLRLVRAAMPALSASGHGRVINIVSLSGKRLLSETNLGYAASKFAAMALHQAIRRAGWDAGLRATAICPGLVDTDMVAGVAPPPGQFKIEPQAIAASAAYALSLSNDASVAEILINSRLETSF